MGGLQLYLLYHHLRSSHCKFVAVYSITKSALEKRDAYRLGSAPAADATDAHRSAIGWRSVLVAQFASGYCVGAIDKQIYSGTESVVQHDAKLASIHTHAPLPFDCLVHAAFGCFVPW